MVALMSRNQLLARVHVLKKQLALDDDLYRDVLQQQTGRRSAAELNDGELMRVISGMEQRQGEGAARHKRGRGKSPFVSPAGRMLQALWISLYNLGAVADRRDEALMAFVARQTQITRPEWLRNSADVKAVAEALKSWLAREGVTLALRAMPARSVCDAQLAKLMRLGAVAPGLPLDDHARAVMPGAGEPSLWRNAQWAELSKMLGHDLRRAMKSTRAA